MAAPMWLARRTRSARAIAADVPLVPGERLLLAIAGHSPVTATDRAIYHRAPGSRWRRLGWHLVDHVRWNAATGTLTFSAPRANQPHFAVQMNSSGNSRILHSRTRALIDLVHERINSTIVTAHRTRIDDVPVHIAARREPGAAAVDWVVMHRDRGRTASAAGVAAVVNELRTQTGLDAPSAATPVNSSVPAGPSEVRITSTPICRPGGIR